jgi:hypothetical protein
MDKAKLRFLRREVEASALRYRASLKKSSSAFAQLQRSKNPSEVDGADTEKLRRLWNETRAHSEGAARETLSAALSLANFLAES